MTTATSTELVAVDEVFTNAIWSPAAGWDSVAIGPRDGRRASHNSRGDVA